MNKPETKPENCAEVVVQLLRHRTMQGKAAVSHEQTLAHSGVYKFHKDVVHVYKFDHLNKWWRHEMEKNFRVTGLCGGNSPVTGECPAQRPVTWSFDIFVDLRLE